jgi:uncharacterized protein
MKSTMILFDWDEGNLTKSVSKHGITNIEAQSIFFDSGNLIYFDQRHSGSEKRYICIGNSSLKRLLIAYFTVRGQRIRIIGTRIANKKERKIYEK